MGSLKLPPTLQSVFDYARSVLRAPPSGVERKELGEVVQPPEIAPVRPHAAAVGRDALRLDQHNVFAHGDTRVTLAVHNQQAGSTDAPSDNDSHRLVVSATLETLEGGAGSESRVTLSLAAIRGIRQLLSSAVGTKLMDWLDLLEHSSGTIATTERNAQALEGEVVHLSPQVEIRKQYLAIASRARQCWDDAKELDEAYQAYNAKLLEWREVFGKEWRTLFGRDWEGPAFFETVNQRAAFLRRGLAQPAGASRQGQTSAEQREYKILCREVGAAWNDVGCLQELARELRSNLPRWNATLPAGWQGERELDRLQVRIAALLAPPGPGTQTTEIDEGPSSAGRQRGTRSPPGVPEWPHEAKATQAVALAGDQFSYSHGVLSYMGYRVGNVSTLTVARRRKIPEYVFLGELPQVNDRQYMRTWGRPRTAARLRKLANAVATFARNARRKRTKNMKKAIAEWEADLAYLKKRYYDARARDWRWPEVLRQGRR